MNNQSNQELIKLLDARFKYVEPQHLREMFSEFVSLVMGTIRKSEDPVFDEYQPGLQPYIVNYHNRRHLFVFNTAATDLTLNSTDGFQYLLPAQVWVPMGFKGGTAFTSVAGRLLIKCTDEVSV